MRRFVLVLLLASVLAPSARADTIVDAFRAGNAIAAGGGHLVFDSGKLTVVLTDLHAGRRRRLAELKAFSGDLDVGTDARGKPVVTFSRCAGLTIYAGEDRIPTGCHAYVLELTGPRRPPRRLRAVDQPGTSVRLPAMWRGRLAFARSVDRVPGDRISTIELQRRPGSKRTRLLRHGGPPPCRKRRRGCGIIAAPLELDLGSAGVAFSWYVEQDDPAHGDLQLRVASLGGHDLRTVDSGYVGECFSEGPAAVFENGITLVGTKLTYLRDVDDLCAPSRTKFVERDLRSGVTRRWQPPGGIARDLATDGDVYFWVRGPLPGDRDYDASCEPGGCQLVRTLHPPLTR